MLQLQLQPGGARSAAELEGAFAAMARARAQARDTLKRPLVAETLLNGDAEQRELLPDDYSEFPGSNKLFARRKSLMRRVEQPLVPRVSVTAPSRSFGDP